MNFINPSLTDTERETCIKIRDSIAKDKSIYEEKINNLLEVIKDSDKDVVDEFIKNFDIETAYKVFSHSISFKADNDTYRLKKSKDGRYYFIVEKRVYFEEALKEEFPKYDNVCMISKNLD